MKKLFVNKTTYTQDVYVDFLKFHNKTYNLSYMLYTIFWSALFLLCIYLSFSSNNKLQGVFITIIFICFIIYRVYHPKMVITKEIKSDKISDTSTNIFSFFDNNFQIKNSNGTFTYRYFMLHKVFETSDFFYLYANRENAFLISKSAFSLGTPEEFSKFIKNKCKFKFRKK